MSSLGIGSRLSVVQFGEGKFSKFHWWKRYDLSTGDQRGFRDHKGRRLSRFEDRPSRSARRGRERSLRHCPAPAMPMRSCFHEMLHGGIWPLTNCWRSMHISAGLVCMKSGTRWPARPSWRARPAPGRQAARATGATAPRRAMPPCRRAHRRSSGEGWRNNRESNERQCERVSLTSWFRYAVSRSSLRAFPFRKCSESCSVMTSANRLPTHSATGGVTAFPTA